MKKFLFTSFMIFFLFSKVSAENAYSLKKMSSEKKEEACIISEEAISDFKEKKEEVLKLKKQIEEKEKELADREKVITEEMNKLEELRKTIEGISEVKKKESESRIAKLVETVEKMSPKSAGKLLASVDLGLAVEVSKRMDTVKLAKILNGVDASKVAKISERLTLWRVKKEKEKEKKKETKKGGEHASYIYINSKKLKSKS